MSERSRSAPVARTNAARASRRIVFVVVLVALLAVSTIDPAGAAYRRVDTTEGAHVARTMTLLAPAVGELPNGTLVGVTMRLEVTVRNGTGGVYVDTRPLTQVDMQGSARLAASVAASIAGRPFADHDYFITMRTDVPTVGGPSAGATMTVGFTALLLGLPVRDDVVMTGMVNPDGTVGPVGGILEKAEAAHRAGADLFLIPDGQDIVRRIVREVQGDGWFPQIVQREERINVTEYARDAWGLEVRTVSDVYAALEAFTDHRVERPTATPADPSDLFITVMGDASRDQVASAHAELDRLRGALADSGLQAAAPNTHSQLAAVLDRVADRLGRAERAAGNGSYYTASSLAFQSLVDLRLVDVWLQTLAADDQRDFLGAHGRDLADRLAATRTRAAEADASSVSGLEAVGAAQVRVMEAERRLAEAEAAHADDRLADAVQALSFAEERRRSVEWWLDIQERLVSGGATAPLRADPGSLASDYYGIAQQAVAYAEVLISQTGASANLNRLLGEAATLLGDAAAAESGGLDAGAMYLAMEAQAAAYAALSLVGSEDLLEDRIARQREQALLNIGLTREAGAEPFLAVSFVDFADTLRGSDAIAALQMYGNAATIAATSRVLATGEVCGFGPVSCGPGVPQVSRVAFQVPDPWTAYLALATLLLGFMAGLLVTLLAQQGRARRAPAHTPPGAQVVAFEGPVPLPVSLRPHRPALPGYVPRPPHGAHAHLVNGRRVRRMPYTPVRER